MVNRGGSGGGDCCGGWSVGGGGGDCGSGDMVGRGEGGVL